MNFLNWQSGDGIAITSPQLIAYCDESGNVTNLPQLQFVITVSEQNGFYYPIVGAYDCANRVVFKTVYRAMNDFDTAFNYAKCQVEEAFQGSYESGILSHNVLNGWTFEIMKEIKNAT